MAFDRVLDLRGVLMDLVADGRLLQEDANMLLGASRTREQAIAKDQAFQTTQRPVGMVFGFGIIIGILVALGGGVYFAVLTLLKVPELTLVYNLAKRFLPKRTH